MFCGFCHVLSVFQDGVSHLSHLVGAVVGGYCGYAMGQADQRTGGGRNDQRGCISLQQCLAIQMDLMAIAAIDQKYWLKLGLLLPWLHFDTLRSHVKKPLFMIAPVCFATSGAMRATSEALVSSSGFPLWGSGSQRQCFSASTQWYAVTSEIQWIPMRDYHLEKKTRTSFLPN